MWKSLTVIILGVVSGVAAHMGYFNAYTPECSPFALECEMEWLREELDLSEEQFVQVAQVHNQSGSEIKALAKRVRELELLMAELESLRVREGYVDFMEIRDYMETKAKLDEACLESTSRLIASVGSIMDVNQRARYLTIVSKGTIN